MSLPDLRHQMTLAERDDIRRTAHLLDVYVYPLLIERQGGRCAICGCPAEDGDVAHEVYHPEVTLNELRLTCRGCHVEEHPEAPLLKGANQRIPSGSR